MKNKTINIIFCTLAVISMVTGTLWVFWDDFPLWLGIIAGSSMVSTVGMIPFLPKK